MGSVLLQIEINQLQVMFSVAFRETQTGITLKSAIRNHMQLESKCCNLTEEPPFNLNTVSVSLILFV